MMLPNPVCDAAVSILALLFAFGPGWFFSLCLFPDARRQWHIAMGIGLGIVLIGLAALGLSYLPIGITRRSVPIALVVLNILLGIWLLATHRRKGRTPYRTWHILRSRTKPNWKKHLPSSLMCIVLSLFLVVAPSLARKQRESYTEFYIVDAYFDIAPWRRSVDSAVLFPVTVAVVSNEKTAESFKICVKTEEETTQIIQVGVLRPGESTLLHLRIPPRVNDAQRYDVLLFKGDSYVPYRTLYFWLRAA